MKLILYLSKMTNWLNGAVLVQYDMICWWLMVRREKLTFHECSWSMVMVHRHVGSFAKIWNPLQKYDYGQEWGQLNGVCSNYTNEESGDWRFPQEITCLLMIVNYWGLRILMHEEWMRSEAFYFNFPTLCFISFCEYF